MHQMKMNEDEDNNVFKLARSTRDKNTILCIVLNITKMRMK